MGSPDYDELFWTAYHDASGSMDLPLGETGYKVSLSVHPAEAAGARFNIVILLSILAVTFATMFFYTGIFARQITEPLRIMNKGMRIWDYDQKVPVARGHEKEEVFLLAHVFNVRWLPLKDQLRRRREENELDI